MSCAPGDNNGAGTFYGKYRGKVLNNIDPLLLGRVMVEVASVPGSTLNYAMPCVPYAGFQVGFYAIPPIGANVWVEFEGGDPNYPIWAGCFWGEGEVPLEAPPEIKVFKTEFITMILNDLEEVGGFTLECIAPAVDVPLTMTFNSEGITLSCPEATINMTPESITITVPEADLTMTAESITMTVPASSLTMTAETIEIETPEMNVQANVNITGEVEIEGNTGITGATEIEGNTDITGAVEIEGNTSVTGAIELDGNTNIGGLLEIEGETNALGAVTAEGEVNVAGNVSIEGSEEVIGLIEGVIVPPI